ncbi:MAG: hypothetical protein Q8898_04455, partial [Bacillota bacterium]|nr:hypothetical protein [Bacillota bacterium]
RTDGKVLAVMGYKEIKLELGHRPTRTEMYRTLGLDFFKLIRDGCLKYLANQGNLNTEELGWLNSPVEDFLIYLEHTRFDKSYKIPTLLSFVTQENGLKPSVTLTEIAQSFIHFYCDYKTHQVDFCNKCHKDWHLWSVDQFADLALRNPVTYLAESGSQFFRYDADRQVLSLDPCLEEYIKSRLLAEHVLDIMRFRELDYFDRRIPMKMKRWDAAAEAAAGYE